jgi:hypothetical protein
MHKGIRLMNSSLSLSQFEVKQVIKIPHIQPDSLFYRCILKWSQVKSAHSLAEFIDSKMYAALC